MIQEHRNKAASKLQRAWRRHRIFSLIPKALVYRKNLSILMIQKYMRGYKVYSKINSTIRQKHMKESFEYFTNLRSQVMDDLSSYLVFAWKRFKCGLN